MQGRHYRGTCPRRKGLRLSAANGCLLVTGRSHDAGRLLHGPAAPIRKKHNWHAGHRLSLHTHGWHLPILLLYSGCFSHISLDINFIANIALLCETGCLQAKNLMKLFKKRACEKENRLALAKTDISTIAPSGFRSTGYMLYPYPVSRYCFFAYTCISDCLYMNKQLLLHV